jgi:hypothetical protein
MPIQAIEITDTYVLIRRSGEEWQFFYADFPQTDDTPEKKVQRIIDNVQRQFLDTRIKLSDLPDDDPDKNTDPGLPHLFHEGQGGNAELVSRSIVIEDVTWDDNATPPLQVSFRRIFP